MPAVKSAKLTSAKSRPCNATIAAQIQGRTLRNKLSGSKSQLEPKAVQVAMRRLSGGISSSKSLSALGRARGFART